MTTGIYSIRRATVEGFQFLPAVENAAGEVFKDIGYDDIAAMPPAPVDKYSDLLKVGGIVWTAENSDHEIIAYCAVFPLKEGLYIKELSVHKLYAKQGLGSRLLKETLTAAKSEGYKSAFLLTFKNVPFNAPYYARFGFEIITDLTPYPTLKRLAKAERKTPLWKYGRVAMKLNLT